MKPIKKNNECTYRPISRECTVCRQEYDLMYHTTHSSQRYCGHECHIKLKSTHKGMRDHAILTVLKERGSLTSLQISDILSGCKLRVTQRTVGNILKLYKARGVVTAHRRSFKKAYTYKYISELFPGELVIKYAKA